MIYIRVDANEQIATGHVMRCLSIAEALIQKGEICTFITADNYSNELILSKGFHVECLYSKWNQLELEIEKLLQLIQKQKIEKLLIDSYYVTEKYMREIGKYTQIIYIDDLNLFSYPVDMLINYSHYYHKFIYESTYHNSKTKLLLGCKYVPLRKEFVQAQTQIANRRFEKIKNILITTGGTDSYNVIGKLLKEMAGNISYKEADLHIVVGKFNQNCQELQELANQNSNVHLYYNIQKMSELMKGCDIAISAGGTTLFELCACGIPSICFALADNQLDAVEDFGNSKIMIYAGDFRDNVQKVLQNIIDGIESLSENYQLRKTYSEKMLELVDGLGAHRIVEEILML